jgi:hypothetical protein
MHYLNEDEPEVLETPEPEVEQTEESTEETVEEETTEEDIEAIKAKAAKADELEKKNKQLYERLKKQKETVPSEQTNLSAKDFLALSEAKVSSEDFDEVVRVAKILNKPLAEALQDKTLRSILNERQEERRTAEATNTRSPRGGAKAPTGEELLKKAERGALPESDDAYAAIFEARLKRRLGNRK